MADLQQLEESIVACRCWKRGAGQETGIPFGCFARRRPGDGCRRRSGWRGSPAEEKTDFTVV